MIANGRTRSSKLTAPHALPLLLSSILSKAVECGVWGARLNRSVMFEAMFREVRKSIGELLYVLSRPLIVPAPWPSSICRSRHSRRAFSHMDKVTFFPTKDTDVCMKAVTIVALFSYCIQVIWRERIQGCAPSNLQRHPHQGSDARRRNLHVSAG